MAVIHFEDAKANSVIVLYEHRIHLISHWDFHHLYVILTFSSSVGRFFLDIFFKKKPIHYLFMVFVACGFYA